MKSVLSFLLLPLLFLVTACTEPAFDQAAVDRVAADFKVKFNQGDYQTIYADSAQGMKAAIDKEAFDKTLGSVAKVLGKIVSYERNFISSAKGAAGEDLVMVKYQTKFEKGVGEQVYFLFPSNGAYLLYQWNINSDDLIKGMVNQIN